MHELSIALSILDVAAEEAQRRGVDVAAVHLKLGPLSGVVPSALQGAFELAREGSLLPDCRLQIQETPIVVFCPACRAERAPVSIQEMCCAVCGTPTPEVGGGREMLVVALE